MATCAILTAFQPIGIFTLYQTKRIGRQKLPPIFGQSKVLLNGGTRRPVSNARLHFLTKARTSLPFLCNLTPTKAPSSYLPKRIHGLQQAEGTSVKRKRCRRCAAHGR